MCIRDRPYTDSVWQDVLALGEKVDQQLLQQDVRLSMGGEPTFVSSEDLDSAQWNEAALGEHKLERATALLSRLKKKFAPDGLTTFAQGKWYPGEVTPRWALICHWRLDGDPLWNDTDELAAQACNPTSDKALVEDAHNLLRCLSDELDLDSSYIKPCLLYTSPSPRDATLSRMPSSA